MIYFNTIIYESIEYKNNFQTTIMYIKLAYYLLFKIYNDWYFFFISVSYHAKNIMIKRIKNILTIFVVVKFVLYCIIILLT